MAKVPKNSICYWCGKPATSLEHTPPRNLFPGVTNDKLIKVPSCVKHNQRKSDSDERFRVFLQAHRESNSVAQKHYKDKTERGLLRPERPGLWNSILEKSTVQFTEDGPKAWTRVSQQEIQTYFEAITRALYFYHTGKTAMDYKVMCFSPQFSSRSLPQEELLDSLMPLLRSNNMVEGSCSSPEIFKYRYFLQSGNGIHFILAMRFYEGINVYGLLVPKGFVPFSVAEKARKAKTIEKINLQSRNEWNKLPGIPVPKPSN